MFFKLFLFCNLFLLGESYKLCVVGAGGKLGRELVYQTIVERNSDILALTSKDVIRMPYRGGGYNEKELMPELKNNKIFKKNYWENITEKYDSIVICTGGSPFKEDYSDKITQKFLEHLSPSCKDISIVSAYSVGDSLEKFSIPFQVMDNLYLRDVYRAKRVQEHLIKDFNGPCRKKIFRPRALSFGNTALPSTSREDLAREILDTIFL